MLKLKIEQFHIALTTLLLAIGFAAAAAAQSMQMPAAPQGHPRLGVIVQAVPFDRLDRMGLSHGVEVQDMSEGGPAQVAGMRRGDLVITLDGEAVYSPQRLQWLVEHADSPTQLKLGLRRGEQALSVTVDATGGRSGSGGDVSQRAFLGIRMQELTADLRRSFGIDVDGGVLVSEVVDGSPAAQAGIRAGDILVGMDRKTIRDDSDVHRVLNYFDPDDQIEVRVVRDGKQQTLPVRLGGVAPSRFHGGLSPQFPFQTWRDWSHPWMEPQQQMPMLPPNMRDRFQDWQQPRLRAPQW